MECIVGTVEQSEMWSVLWELWNGVGCGVSCGNCAMEWDVECLVEMVEWSGVGRVVWEQWNGVGCGVSCGNCGMEWDVECLVGTMEWSGTWRVFCWEGGGGGGGWIEWDVECIIEAVERSGMWHVGMKLGGMELNKRWDVEWMPLLPCWQMHCVPSQQVHSQQKWGPFLSHVIALPPGQRRQSRAFFRCSTQPHAGKPSLCYPGSIRVGGRGVVVGVVVVVVVVVFTIEAGSAG